MPFVCVSFSFPPLTLKTGELQPPISGTNSSKYLSESLTKVQSFQNAATAGTDQSILQFNLDTTKYNTLMSTAVDQEGSAGVDAVKVNFEGGAKNAGVPTTKLNEFNNAVQSVEKVPSNDDPD